MPILLTCTCGKKLQIDDRHAGKLGRCPAGGGTLDIPAGEPRGPPPLPPEARAVPPGAVKQLQHIASQPYVVEHVAAMPDIHVSEGVAVGTVFATEHTLVPGALGGDLGCGVSALRFGFPAASLGPKALAFKQGAFVPRAAQQAGIRIGDTIIGVDGKQPELTFRDAGHFVAG